MPFTAGLRSPAPVCAYTLPPSIGVVVVVVVARVARCRDRLRRLAVGVWWDAPPQPVSATAAATAADRRAPRPARRSRARGAISVPSSARGARKVRGLAAVVPRGRVLVLAHRGHGFGPPTALVPHVPGHDLDRARNRYGEERPDEAGELHADQHREEHPQRVEPHGLAHDRRV